eukprot:11739326-Alexandrium_andersonii.AAC.1
MMLMASSRRKTPSAKDTSASLAANLLETMSIVWSLWSSGPPGPWRTRRRRRLRKMWQACPSRTPQRAW